MNKSQILTISFSLFLTGLLLPSCNGGEANIHKKNTTEKQHDHAAMMEHSKMGDDNRISLNLSPKKAQHQLMNMRSHLVAVESILTYLSKDDFEKASEVASSKLGLTEEMKKMCSSFGNEKFENLGLEFHNNADKMSEIFKNKDKNESLQALSTTMNSCIKCHATFKQ